jgi:hypothetical protein
MDLEKVDNGVAREPFQAKDFLVAMEAAPTSTGTTRPPG